ncbi:hypothetical protein TSAR_001855 [Trichomalopsis sarcophagae]|uniref:Uncharacterized protein n=1 Tax=Trichomalopsis sarcophagae TaxID=543379 RepID=A0A232ELZ6_9HYME|nr:hypothetical protein TSAR_001855 [Trichomalopsis sarcophagae]
MRKVLNNRSLTVQQKQSVLHITARMECIRMKLNTLLVKKGRTLSQSLSQRIKWINLHFFQWHLEVHRLIYATLPHCPVLCQSHPRFIPPIDTHPSYFY